MAILNKHTTFSIKLTVISLFILLATLIMVVALSLQYYFSQSLAKEAATVLFKNTAQRVSDKIHALDTEIGDLTLLLSHYDELARPDTPEFQRPILKVMQQAMLEKPYLYAIYIGYPNGNFYELVNLDSSPPLRQRLNAHPQDRWLVIHIYHTAAGRQRAFYYFDQYVNLTHQRRESSRYFVTDRPWYRQAVATPHLIKTEPYVFHNTQSPGITYAKRIAGSHNVIAADISLDTLSEYLQNLRMQPHSQTLLFDHTGKIFAHSFPATRTDVVTVHQPLSLTTAEQHYIQQLGVLRVSNERNWPPFDFSYMGEPHGYSVDLLNLLAKKLGLTLTYSNGYNWDELVSLFHHHQLDILHSAFYTPQRAAWGLFSQPYLSLAPVLVTRKQATDGTSLAQLDNGTTVAIPAGWAFVALVRQYYPHIHVLEVTDSLAALKAVTSHQADAAFDNQRVVQFLIDRYSLTGLTLHNNDQELANKIDQQLRFIIHQQRPELQALLNKALQSLSPTERQALNRKWFAPPSLARMQREIRSGVVPSPQLVDLAKQSHQGDAMANPITIGDVSYTVYVHHIQTQLGSGGYVGILVPTASLLAPYMAKVRYSLFISFGLLIFILPFLLIFSDMIVIPVKQLATENDKIMHRQFEQVQYIPSRIREINDLSNSMLSMSTAIQQHQQNQQDLIEAFIKLIAQAIDDKSPYTGAHCARVPELAIMLAKSAEHSHAPPFASFEFADQEQWREFTIAAWLHDCGKVTTPEHITDKGSKLETIYNRIHEIRMRFEVLWRDADIAFWRGMAAGGDEAELKVTLSQKHQQIQTDFAFIAQCNLGDEQMDEEKRQQIHAIAQQTWTRHLDNRLGLSPHEAKRYVNIPAPPLPTEAPLLEDSPLHLIPWLRTPTHHRKDKIQMTVPQYQSNLGEIYNLCIAHGTLTAEDRYRINEHIIFTIHMLEALPLPDELARVPEIAGGHHEKLDGTGYPRGLTADNLSMEARILAIADVFEALTATDRPYKEAKTLSEAIDILAQMVKNQHLDKDLFQLLLTSRVYQTYASQFLNPEQCDNVDINQYLS